MKEPDQIGRGYQWDLRCGPPPDDAFITDLVRDLRVSPITARVLATRNFKTPAEASLFLHPGQTPLFNPLQLKGMMTAVSALQRAIDAGKPIWVYGDYDVDGTTGTALLTGCLRQWGAQVDYYIPHRLEEGYGLNGGALREAAEAGAHVVVTVDCGISALEEAALADELGITLIITDHHEPGSELPQAHAVVNPRQPGCPYPFKQLAGVGVAFKLAQALALVNEGFLLEEPALPEEFRTLLDEWLDLVALGTIADVVPLTGENRYLVSRGLQRLNECERPGLQALIGVAGYTDREVGVGQVAFGLAPRLNAAGRMAHAVEGVQLLTTTDLHEAQRLAERLDAVNQERQRLEDEVLKQLELQLAAAPTDEVFFLVLDGDGWHPGVIGIAASRIVDKYHRPVAVVATDRETGLGQASVRSVPGFNVFDALKLNADLLVRYGGHAQAAGFIVELDHLDELRERLNRHAREELTPDQLTGKARADAVVILPDVDERLIEELGQFQPCGVGNPRPTLIARELRVVEARTVGRNGDHLKLRVQDVIEGLSMDAIGFGLALEGVPQPGEFVDALFAPGFNEWQGKRRPQLQVVDLRTTPFVHRRAHRDRLHELLRLNWQQVCKLHPDRELLGRIYIGLKKVFEGQPLVQGGRQLVDQLHHATGRTYSPETVEAALTVFSELGLLHRLKKGDDALWVMASGGSDKHDLYDSPRFVRGALARESVRQFLRYASGAAEEDLAELVDRVQSYVS